MELKTELSLDACHTALQTEMDGQRRRKGHSESNTERERGSDRDEQE